MPDHDTFDPLFSRACDGTASEEDWRELAARLRADRTALDAWIHYVDLHAGLATAAAARHGKITAFPVARRWPARIAALAAAVALLVSLAWFFTRSPQRDDQPVAAVDVEVLEARDTDASLAEGQRAQLTALQFASGSLRFRLSSGVVLSAVGPLEMQLLDPMRVRVLHGRLTADVGENGKGFVVETANATVLDLGTVFGVDVGASDDTDVVVFSGKVEVHEPKGTEGALLASLTEGQAMRVGKKHRHSRIPCVFTGKGREEWATQPQRGIGPVITGVRDNLGDRRARGTYHVAVGGMTAGVTFRRAHPLRWRPATGDILPGWLEGADVVDAPGTEDHPADFQMTITLARPAALYVFSDERQPPPPWLRERFMDTGARLLLESVKDKSGRDSAAKPFSVWKMDVPQPGEITLGAQADIGSRSQGRVYRIAAKALF